MSSFESRRTAIVEAAVDWRAPDHPPRQEALESTLDAPNRWTEEALTYALNRWMQRLTTEGLDRWFSEEELEGGGTVGVLHGASDPLEGLRDAVAVWGSGHTYVGHVPEASPALLPAFAEEVGSRTSGLETAFVSRETLLDRADAVMAQPDREEVDALRDVCETHGIPANRRLLRPSLYAIGVLDGHESEDVRDRLAEDLLLYEGDGHRRLAVLWAPRDCAPDPYLQAMARFRGAFPVHPDTPGTLQMQKAFLEARDEPRAFAEGLEFLVSRGVPEPKPPGHFRWTEYDDLGEVEDFLKAHQDEFSTVVAREGLHDQLPVDGPLRTPGGLHIPPLDDAEGKAIASFVRSLA